MFVRGPRGYRTGAVLVSVNVYGSLAPQGDRVEVRVCAIVISRDTVSWCNGQLKAGRLRTGQRKAGGWLGFMEKAAQKAAFHSLLYKFSISD